MVFKPFEATASIRIRGSLNDRDSRNVTAGCPRDSLEPDPFVENNRSTAGDVDVIHNYRISVEIPDMVIRDVVVMGVWITKSV